jgi:hypothetical protein
LKRLGKHYFSLLTNSENFGIPILNQFAALKPKYSASPFSFSPYHGEIKHINLFLKDIIIITDAVGLRNNLKQ